MSVAQNLEAGSFRKVFLELPWPVSTNAYWGHTSSGRKYVTNGGKSFKASVKGEVLDQLGLRHEPLAGRLAMRVYLAAPDRRQRDVDNHAGKSLLDALMDASVFDDDSQVDLMLVQRCEIEKGGRCFVSIEEVPGDGLPAAPRPDEWEWPALPE